MRKLCWHALLVGLIALVPSGLQAQSTGTLTGTVVDANSQRPLSGVQIFVVGTQRGSLSNQQGQFTVTGVPAGQQQVRATLVGFAPSSQTISVTPGQTVTVDFSLEMSAVELGAVIVTATGTQQSVREIGSSVGVIDVQNVELAPVTSFSDLIQGRSAGVTVMQSSGTTGSGSRIRIRGSNSMSLSNSPLLVIDGVRVDAAVSGDQSLGFGVGGQTPSRLNDLNPEDIESIEILKGPSASSLYGTAAANGVIQVTTRRGRAGAPQLRAWSEYGQLSKSVDFPDNVTVLDEDGNSCPFVFQTSGICTPATEQYRYNPVEGGEIQPFETGVRTTIGASVSGGSDQATFYVSGEYEDEDGVFAELDGLTRTKLQTNLTGRVTDRLNVGASVSWLDSRLRLPQADNALFGITGMSLYADADPATIERTGGFEDDYQFFLDWKTFQDQRRFTGSVNGDFEATSWLRLNGLIGLDQTSREEVNRLPQNTAYAAFGGVYSNGFIQNYTSDVRNLTTSGNATALFSLTPELVSTTSVGTQWLREDFHRIYAFGAGLIPGVEESLAGATSDYEAGEDNILNSTVSAYLQQQLAWRDRVFVNAAVRGDKNTAFGTDIGWIWYPSLSGSWVVSDEPFFPENSFFSSFRLRGAVGQSGLRPGVTDALFYFNPRVVTQGNTDVQSVSVAAVGNPDLQPERVTEFEAGFEAGALNDRLGLEMTYFRRNSRDALVNVPLALSVGGSLNRFENLGRVRNSGLELMVSGTPLLEENYSLDLTLSGSTLNNELIELGTDLSGDPLPPIIVNSRQRHVEGYPLGGWWQLPYTFEDSNGDGALSIGEVQVGDTAVFMGSPFPDQEFALSGQLRLWNVRFSGLLDYKGGYKLANMTRAWRNTFEANSDEAYNPSSLEEQAAQIALHTANTYAGYIEDASFVKLRELSMTVGLPSATAERIGVSGLSLTLAGRNLATWTDYKGFDPEVNYQGQANFTTADFSTMPPNRLWTIRIDANF